MKNFKYSTQTINKKDVANVSKVLTSEFCPQLRDYRGEIKFYNLTDDQILVERSEHSINFVNLNRDITNLVKDPNIFELLKFLIIVNQKGNPDSKNPICLRVRSISS